MSEEKTYRAKYAKDRKVEAECLLLLRRFRRGDTTAKELWQAMQKCPGGRVHNLLSRELQHVNWPGMQTLRVWHIPQIPGEPFRVAVRSVEEGVDVLCMLAEYDLFLLQRRIRPDYANVQGLEVLVDGEWEEWEDKEGRNIREIPQLKASAWGTAARNRVAQWPEVTDA